jgi:penicillin amidase
MTPMRWIVRALLGLALLLCAAGVAAWLYMQRATPVVDGTLTLSGARAEIRIERDAHGIPTIRAASVADAAYGLGVVHAQDRLWQMTMLRRTAQGRLSELFGAATVQVDELMRRYDLYGLALQSVKAQDPQSLAALEAYAAGVNAWIAEVNKGARGRGAPEFFLFEPEISAWAPADSIAILKLMALQLSGALQTEVLRARVSLLLPPERLADILPDDPGQGIAAIPDYASLVPGVTPTSRPVEFAEGPLSPVAGPGMAGAANSWAAMPGRSAAGGSLLANDPHLGLTAPTIWYLARLELSTGGVIGGTIPGTPLVLVGRSDRLGWGLTTAYVDDQDVVIEALNPDDPEEYRTADGWARFESRQSIIKVKDAPPVTLTLRWSRNGPVLPGGHYDLGSITPAGHVAAISWTALSGTDTSMSGALALMRAQNVDEALEAGRLVVAPAQNLMLADGAQIAMQVVGAIPARDAGHPSQGRLPALGSDPRVGFRGILPYADNPRFLNPKSGLLGNTNNKTVDRAFPNHVSFDWGDTQRIQRWLTLMKAREVHTRESFIEAQLDTVNPTARTLLPLIGADLWFTGEAAPDGTPEQLRQRALVLLAEWNGEMNEHLPEPLIAEAWLRALMQRLVQDELGAMSENFTHISPVFIERVYRNVDGASVWCDVIQSATVESCTDIARIALDQALLELTEKYGRNIESWRWGDAHLATQDHPVLGEVPVLKYFVNIRQSTSGGDDTLMRGVTRGEGPEPYQNVHAAGYRGVYDFADPDSSVFIIATGQSGHPLSRHYDDLGELWRRGEYIPMSLDPDLARAAAAGVMVLTPQGP